MFLPGPEPADNFVVPHHGYGLSLLATRLKVIYCTYSPSCEPASQEVFTPDIVELNILVVSVRCLATRYPRAIILVQYSRFLTYIRTHRP